MNNKLIPWNAWRPILTEDAGMIWAWPWKRVQVWWCYEELHPDTVKYLEGYDIPLYTIYYLNKPQEVLQ